MSDPIDENERNAPVPDDLWGKKRAETPTSRIKGIAVFVDCEVCEGEGKAYLHEASRFPSECPGCEGEGVVVRRLDVAMAKNWLRDLLADRP